MKKYFPDKLVRNSAGGPSGRGRCWVSKGIEPVSTRQEQAPCTLQPMEIATMNTLRQTNRVHSARTFRFPFKPLWVSIALLGGAVATAEADTAKLVGTWKAQVHFVDCASDQALGEPFSALGTYYADGNATEVPSSGPATRSPSFGTWAKAGKRTYAVYSQFWLYDANGFYAGYQVLNRMLEVAKDGQTFDVQATTSRYDSDGVLLGSGCAAGSGERLPKPTPF